MKWIQKHGTYTRLLMSLILIVILTPVFSLIPFGNTILNLAMVAVIAMAVLDIARSPRLLTIAVVLGAPAMAFRIAFSVDATPGQSLGLAASGLIVVFMTFAAIQISWDISVHSIVSNDTIRGAICAYLFFGFAWASLYEFIVLLQPGAIDFGTGVGGGPAGENFMYYSFVVLTTLGFGDVLPISPLARGLTWIEAVVGQLFIATVIARLVGLRLAGLKSDSKQIGS